MAVGYLGLIAYEWLSTGFRGGWILVIFMMLLGAFLRFSVAVVVGILSFILLIIYFLFDFNHFVFNIGRQLLLLFILPFAPLFLSAFRDILNSNRQTDKILDNYRLHLANNLLPIGTFKTTELQIHKLLKHHHIEAYETLSIRISNHALLRDMLNVEEWKAVQNQILAVLHQDHESSILYFTDARMSLIKSIIIHVDEQNVTPHILEQLHQIPNLKLHIEQKYQTFESLYAKQKGVER
ncbi:hypothetical protein C9426_20390 [Serratia sp. S1B]|nr:hypothetical protein C9426_20390 [Serratia sp. S1B]